MAKGCGNHFAFVGGVNGCISLRSRSRQVPVVCAFCLRDGDGLHLGGVGRHLSMDRQGRQRQLLGCRTAQGTAHQGRGRCDTGKQTAGTTGRAHTAGIVGKDSKPGATDASAAKWRSAAGRSSVAILSRVLRAACAIAPTVLSIAAGSARDLLRWRIR